MSRGRSLIRTDRNQETRNILSKEEMGGLEEEDRQASVFRRSDGRDWSSVDLAEKLTIPFSTQTGPTANL